MPAKIRHSVSSVGLQRGLVSRRSRNLFVPGEPEQTLKPYEHRAVLFSDFKYEQRFSSYNKFQAPRAPLFVNNLRRIFLN